jgi:hypothetical protein
VGTDLISFVRQNLAWTQIRYHYCVQDLKWARILSHFYVQDFKWTRMLESRFNQSYLATLMTASLNLTAVYSLPSIIRITKSDLQIS